MPVGRVKERNPLGHSGHLRLHEVVGSIARAIGMPLISGRFDKRER
ncbi:MAG TPA: hypothetical protein VKZ68_11100 [Ohtaekwangia sp.]|nr:hypothetical protein [Ohtaekwangia sp.]